MKLSELKEAIDKIYVSTEGEYVEVDIVFDSQQVSDSTSHAEFEIVDGEGKFRIYGRH